MKPKFRVWHMEQKEVNKDIADCQRRNHIHQVAFSTFHHAITQVCFTCEIIRTSLSEEDIK